MYGYYNTPLFGIEPALQSWSEIPRPVRGIFSLGYKPSALHQALRNFPVNVRLLFETGV